MSKTIICHCEDVSLGELLSAIDQGYRDIESIKRYTGIATGPCQGKCCLVQTLRVLLRYPDARASAEDERDRCGGPNGGNGHRGPAVVKLPTIRKPVLPMRIRDIQENEP